MPSTLRTVVAAFEDSTTAERAVSDLVNAGFPRDQIQITSNRTFTSDSAIGGAGLSGRQPRDTSGGGIAGFFRRLFGTDDEYSSHYEEAVRRGGAVVSVTTEDENRASDILDRAGAIDVEERAASWRSEGYNPSRATNTPDRSIPVVREELHVGKREVQKGGVRVYNRVEEQPVEEKVRLREEHVRVDRRPADRAATEKDFRAHDEVIEITETAEEPVIGKTARVVEEVIVGKESTERTETIRDTVRRSNVNVEKLGTGDRSWQDYDDDFRHDFQTRYGAIRDARYEAYAPAYQYGYRMASDQRYRGRRWDDVEPSLRTDYERTYPDGKWEQMKDSIRYGWDKITQRR